MLIRQKPAGRVVLGFGFGFGFGFLILASLAARGDHPSNASTASELRSGAWEYFAEAAAPRFPSIWAAEEPKPSPPKAQQADPSPPAPPVFTVGLPVAGLVTHYGVSFNGQSLGCGLGSYSSGNPGIVAVGPERYAEWPCGTAFRICGDAGCIIGTRQDACPGCGPNHLDLSESGIGLVCGDQASVCRVSIEQVVPIQGRWHEYS